MKRKKPAAVPAVKMENTGAVPATVGETSPLNTVWVCLFSVLLFLSMTIQTGRMSLVLAVLAVVLSVGKEPLRRLRERLCIPVLGLVAFAMMNGLAAIYSAFGSYAVSEFYKIFASFSLAVLLLVRFDKSHVRGLLWGIAVVSALIALLSIDASSANGLFQFFNGIVQKLGASYADVEQNTWGTRVAGIYNDANVTASIFALGSLVSLYLMNSGKSWRGKLPAALLLGLSAQVFFLSLSRGAILCFAVALLVWLIAAQKGERLPLFLLMFVSAAVTLGVSIVVTPAIGTESMLPDVLSLFSGLPIFLLDWVIGSRLARALEGHGKGIAAVAAVLVLASAAYAVAALLITGPTSLNTSGHLSRIMELAPGEYTVSGDWDEEITLQVGYRFDNDLGNSSELYSGPIEEAVFTVPEETGQVVFGFSGEPGKELRQVTLSDGTKIPLGYPLLPDFVANRMQGNLFASSSFVLRVQFMKDAWTLFLKSPLIGHGLGSTEGLYTSVQPYFYESLYVHNHILQVMDDMGLLGLAPFLALLLGSAWLLLKNLRSESGSLAAMLLACWVMMNSHGLMEINFSIRAYQCVAFVLLLLPVLLYAKPLSAKIVKWGGLAVSAFIWLYLAVFGALLESHRMVDREMQEFSTTDVHEFMETLESYVRRDVFDHEQNQLTYVGNAVILNDSDYNGNMRRYAEELRASGTYTACSGLARYYYLPKGQFEELFACSREGIAQEASVSDAWNLQLDFYRNEVLPAAGVEHMDEFTDGVLALRDYLEEYSQGRMEEIELTEENQTFLNAVSSAKEIGMPADGMYLYLTQMLFEESTSETPAE